MKCRNCGHDNPEYSEVCENCAVSLRSEPQRDDDTPSWGFVDENKDIRFSFGGRNAAQNNNPADMNQNTDSDLDELERQFFPSWSSRWKCSLAGTLIRPLGVPKQRI